MRKPYIALAASLFFGLTLLASVSVSSAITISMVNGSCTGGTVCLFSMNATNNSHAGECGYFNVSVCGDFTSAAIRTGSCNEGESGVLLLFQRNNSHVGAFGTSNYGNTVCVGGSYTATTRSGTSCNAGETILVSINATNNSHAASAGYFGNQVCLVQLGPANAVPRFADNNTYQGTTRSATNTYTYSSSNISASVNVTDTDGDLGIDTVIFGINGTGNITNKGITGGSFKVYNKSVGGQFYVNLSSLAVGTYNAFWWANDSSNAQNQTANFTITISRNTTTLGLTASASDATYPAMPARTCSESREGDSDIVYRCFRNSTDSNGLPTSTMTNLANGSSVTDSASIGVGTYAINISAHATGGGDGANYSAASAATRFVISVNSTTTGMSCSASGTTYPTMPSRSCSETRTGDGDLVYRLYRNSTNSTGQPTSSLTNIVNGSSATDSASIGVGTYGLIYNTSTTSGGDGANYSANASGITSAFTISRGTLKDFLDARIDTNVYNTSITQTYPTDTNNINGRFNSTDAYGIRFDLFINGLNQTAQNNTNVQRSAGTYTIVYGTTNATSANWTIGNASSITLTISKNSTALGMSVSASDTTYPTMPTRSASENRIGDDDMVYRLYRNSTNSTGQPTSGLTNLVNGSSASDSTTLGTGTWGLLYNTSTTSGGDGINYSANSTGAIVRFVISRGTPSITLTPSTSTITYNATTNEACSTTNDDTTASANFYVNVTNGTAYAKVTPRSGFVYPGGVHTVSCDSPITQNYTQANSNSTIVVSNATATLNLFIDSLPVNKTITYPTIPTLTANTTSSGVGIPTFTFYRNNTNLGSGSSASSGIALGVASYQLIYNTSGNQNYSSASNSSLYLIVNKGALKDFLDARIDTNVYNTSVSQTYPTDTNNISGRFNSTGAGDVTFKLFISGADLTSQNNTNVQRSAGTYTIIYGTATASAANWTTGNTSSLTLTINQGATSVQLFLNGSRTNQTFSVNKAVNLTATVNVSGLTVSIDTNITGWSTQSAANVVSNITNMTSKGRFNITGYYLGNTNYTASTETFFELSSDAPTITVQSPTNVTFITLSVWANVTQDWEGSWCGRSLDGGSNVTLTNSSGNWNNFMLSLAKAPHSVRFYCNDTIGNMGASSTIFFTVGVNSLVISGNSFYSATGLPIQSGTVKATILQTGESNYTAISSGNWQVTIQTVANLTQERTPIGIFVNDSAGKSGYYIVYAGFGPTVGATSTCATNLWRFSGIVADASTGSFSSAGNVSVSIQGTAYANTTRYSNGVWDIYLRACLVPGTAFTTDILLTDTSGRSGLIVLRQVAK